MIVLPYEKEVDVKKFESMLDYKSCTTSYKLFWLSAIFQEVIRENKVISFRRIVCRMICIAWYPLVQYNLNFGVYDRLYVIVELIRNKYALEANEREENLLRFLENIKDDEFEGMITDFYKYVPYRLISPFFRDEVKGMKDNEVNGKIKYLSNENKNSFYAIKDKNTIEISDGWYEYIKENQSIIDGWLRYKLIYFLQKRNPNVPGIPFKLEPAGKRNLTSAKKYWQEVLKNRKFFDIYTGKEFTRENLSEFGGISIDHFIPWSFVMHDEMWNLVPTFKNINSSKSNSLPNMNEHFEKFSNMQYDAFNIAVKNNYSKKLLEDYINIKVPVIYGGNSYEFENISREKFGNVLRDTISPIYQIAYNQGYLVWNR